MAVSRHVVGSLLAAVGLALLAGGSATAAPARITGELNRSGYTVIALSTGGKVSAVRTRSGKFKLRPGANRVTLHLRDPAGLYGGPIVLGSRNKGRRAVLGVRAGAELGKIKVRPDDGYARASSRPGRGEVDRALLARARKGVPIGAGNFGQVRSKPPRASVAGDYDFDGIPNRVDIDDDGDLVLDKQDRSRAVRAAQTTADPLSLATGVGSTLDRAPNVQAGASDAMIDEHLKELGYMLMQIPRGAAAVELDCGAVVPAGLPYCARGGTGVTQPPPGQPSSMFPFPSCCDGDSDGFGTLQATLMAPGGFQVFGLLHRSATAQIGTGDVLIEHVTLSGDESQCPPPGGTSANCTSLSSVQQYVFATVPALRAFSDGQGMSVTVPYPVRRGDPGTTQDNPYQVSATGSDVILTVTSWPPQRRPTSEAECSQPSPTCTQNEWLDMGGLIYSATVARPGQTAPNNCPPGSVSEADDNLVDGSPGPDFDGVLDQAKDRPTSATNTFTYTVNLTACLGPGNPFNVGDTLAVGFNAFTPATGGETADNAHQSVWFRRGS